jgi:hypothetical protein
MSDELLTMAWPRSSKNFRKRRRISLLFMKSFQFLSYFLLFISKTAEGAKKTSRLAPFERGVQTPNVHCSLENVSKRRPVPRGDRFVSDFARYASVNEIRKNPGWVRVFSLGNHVFGVSPVVEKSLFAQSSDDLLRDVSKFLFQLLAQLLDRVIPSP